MITFKSEKIDVSDINMESISIQTNELVLSEVVDSFRRFLLAMGYTQKSIDDYIADEDRGIYVEERKNG